MSTRPLADLIFGSFMWLLAMFFLIYSYKKGRKHEEDE